MGDARADPRRGLGPSRRTRSLIRRAARMAARAGGELVAVHVIPEDGLARAAARSMNHGRPGRRRWADRSTRSWAAGIPDALLDFARAENVHADRRRARRRSRGGVTSRADRSINRIIRASGAIDVHVISHEAAPAGGSALRIERPAGLPRSRTLAGFVAAAVALPLVTLVLRPVPRASGLSSILLHLPVASSSASRRSAGLWPAVAAAVAASLLVNWYFTPPIHTWTIAEAGNLFAHRRVRPGRGGRERAGRPRRAAARRGAAGPRGGGGAGAAGRLADVGGRPAAEPRRAPAHDLRAHARWP